MSVRKLTLIPGHWEVHILTYVRSINCEMAFYPFLLILGGGPVSSLVGSAQSVG